jgi:hypothetical protein
VLGAALIKDDSDFAKRKRMSGAPYPWRWNLGFDRKGLMRCERSATFSPHRVERKRAAEALLSPDRSTKNSRWTIGYSSKCCYQPRLPRAHATTAICAKRKCKVFKKRGAQHVRIKGQAVDLSPRMRRHRGTDDWRVVSPPFQFSSRSGQRMERGSVGGDYTSRKRQFSRFTAGLRSKVREGHPDESNALRRREHGPD